jgi:hypothetical protein
MGYRPLKASRGIYVCINSRGQIGSGSEYGPPNGSETGLPLNIIAALQEDSPMRSGTLKRCLEVSIREAKLKFWSKYEPPKRDPKLAY